MKKKMPSKSTKEIKKDYSKIMKGFKPVKENISQFEWNSSEDYFTKFSLYKETRSGVTSIESSITANF